MREAWSKLGGPHAGEEVAGDSGGSLQPAHGVMHVDSVKPRLLETSGAEKEKPLALIEPDGSHALALWHRPA